MTLTLPESFTLLQGEKAQGVPKLAAGQKTGNVPLTWKVRAGAIGRYELTVTSSSGSVADGQCRDQEIDLLGVCRLRIGPRGASRAISRKRQKWRAHVVPLFRLLVRNVRRLGRRSWLGAGPDDCPWRVPRQHRHQRHVPRDADRARAIGSRRCLVDVLAAPRVAAVLLARLGLRDRRRCRRAHRRRGRPTPVRLGILARLLDPRLGVHRVDGRRLHRQLRRSAKLGPRGGTRLGHEKSGPRHVGGNDRRFAGRRLRLETGRTPSGAAPPAGQERSFGVPA